MKTFSEILSDPSSTAEQRIQAVFQLMLQDNDEAINSLGKTLQEDPSPIVRHEAAYCLGEMTSNKAESPLISAIQNDKNPFVIHEAMLALSNRGNQASESYIEPLMNHKIRDVALTANISLQRIQFKNNPRQKYDNPSKILLSSDSLEEERIQASFVLMEDASPDAVNTLVKAMQQEEDPIVKHEIIFSLGETAASWIVPDLIKTMETDSNLFVIHEALLALGTLGDKTALPAMKKFIEHPEKDIVESAEIAIERLEREN